MFASFFIRLFFALLLFLIASKKGYARLTWSIMGFLLGPLALLVIFIYRKNADYSKAFLSGLGGTVLGIALALAAWFVYPLVTSIEQAEMVKHHTDVFWTVVLPTFSLSLGAIFFAVSIARTNR